MKNYSYNLYNQYFFIYRKFIWNRLKQNPFSQWEKEGKSQKILNEQRLRLIEKKISQMPSLKQTSKGNYDLYSIREILENRINLQNEKTLKVLAGSRIYVLRALAGQDTKDSKLLAKLGNDPHWMVHIVVAENKYTPKATQIYFAKKGRQLWRLAKLDYVCSEAKDIIAKKSNDKKTLGDVIESPKTSVATLRYLYKYKCAKLKLHSYFISKYANTPSDILNALANPKKLSFKDMWLMAEHLNTSGKTLDYLSRLGIKDFPPSKPNAFRSNLSLYKKMKKAIAKHKNVFKSTIVQLGMDAYEEVREAAAGSHKMPKNMLKQLAEKDPSDKVKKAAKESLHLYHGE
jgi:hypothetical protein